MMDDSGFRLQEGRQRAIQRFRDGAEQFRLGFMLLAAAWRACRARASILAIIFPLAINHSSDELNRCQWAMLRCMGVQIRLCQCRSCRAACRTAATSTVFSGSTTS